LGSRVRIPSPAPKKPNENQRLSTLGEKLSERFATEQYAKLHEKDGHIRAKSVQCCSRAVRPDADPPPQKETAPDGDQGAAHSQTQGWTRAKASKTENSRFALPLQTRREQLPETVIDRARAVPIESEVEARGIRLQGRGPERTGPCPKCGGKDRFSINVQKQVWNCRHCGGGGDIIALVRHLDGLDFRGAVELLAGITPSERRLQTVDAPPPKRDPKADEIVRRNAVLGIWNRAVDPRGTPVERYLNGRGLDLPDEAAFEAIRFHPRCIDDRPGMICLVRNIVTNEPQGIHRTALTLDGHAVQRQGKTYRKSLGSLADGAIKLDPDEAVEMGLCIGEGVETCLAGRQRGFRPVWAALSTRGIANFPILPGIEGLTIFGEADEANARDVEACASRWRGLGCEVIVSDPLLGSDLNDVMRRRAAS
jgi:hypothetical protein